MQLNLKHDLELNFSKAKLDRILTNLLSNAIQAMNGKGKIWVNTETIIIHQNKFIQFTIGNNNSFIKNELREKIFELKYTNGKINGRGIGLYSAKNLIEEAGGCIQCFSSAGKGVEFVFRLPS